jgi:hypothetical protein
MAQGGEQAVSVGAIRADAFCYSLSDGTIIRQQIVENIDDRRADIAVLAQRQGQGDREGWIPMRASRVHNESRSHPWTHGAAPRPIGR